MEADRDLLSLLTCPGCQGHLNWREQQIDCTACGQSYELVDGIPVFADLATVADYKRRQIEYFDGALAEFEIERPNRSTALYGWLMDEKYRRAMAGLEHLVPGISAICVCGGSGMDAEFLARAGARVIVADISLGAALRARERGQRHGVGMTVIVADAERLPLADRAVGLAFVHDGLHHLDDPQVGITEMTRVADTAVSITEPARAAVTAAAVRLGIALNKEEAGNRVERIDPAAAVAGLHDGGFRTVGVQRYAMYYRHRPGPVSGLFSRPRLIVGARAVFSAFNRVAGGIGNKLAIQAVRQSAPGPADSVPQ